MTNAQKISAHTLAGYVEGVLEAVLWQAKLEAIGIEMNGGGVLVQYDIEDGQAVEITLLNQADDLIAKEIEKFNAKNAFDHVAWFEVQLDRFVGKYHVVPMIQTRWCVENGLTGEASRDGEAAGACAEIMGE